MFWLFNIGIVSLKTSESQKYINIFKKRFYENAKKVNLNVALKEKSGDHQSQKNSSSEEHECLHKISSKKLKRVKLRIRIVCFLQ